MNAEETLKQVFETFEPDVLIDFFRAIGVRTFSSIKENYAIESDSSLFCTPCLLGVIRLENENELAVFTVKVVKSLTERSGKKAQYELAKKILKAEDRYPAGIFIFHDDKNDLRFSLIYNIPQATGKRDWSNFKRYTYYLTKEQTNKTFIQQITHADFSSVEKLTEAFSVEKVTKEFYQEIANWYFWGLRKVRFPEDAEKEQGGRNIALIRFITRIIFIWFMREKKLIQNKLFDKNEIKNILINLENGESTYYKAILQNLFFATLNTPVKERKFRKEKEFQGKNKDYMNHSYFRYHSLFKNPDVMLELFQDIPFLNGGLFECLDKRKNDPANDSGKELRIDGFSDEVNNQPIFSNELFFSEDIDVDLSSDYGEAKYKRSRVKGIIRILKSYNFTTDENTPIDEEVALDPELLGKVFENLLASYNPETASTARKATGSYYTPREIVSYMVSESLKEYFKTHLVDVETLDIKLNDLFSIHKEGNPFSAKETRRLVEIIDNLRIVDPAVGSGAFPMGVLNQLVFILSKLDPENELWKEAQLNALEKSITDPVLRNKLKEQTIKQFAEKNSDYGRKLYLIQKCIYGVDIQQIAVEIAKLRFFISLLIDEEIDREKENWGIEPLPNLDFKIMQGNSLISEFMGLDLDADKQKIESKLFEDEIEKLIKEFENKKNDYQNESDKRRKSVLIREINEFILKIFEAELRGQKASNIQKLTTIKEKASTIPNEQQRQEFIESEKESLNRNEKFDLNAVEKQLKEFTEGGKAKPFFAWKLYFAEVFHEKGGFEIVIGNPPYIQLQKALDTKYKYADLYKDQNFKTFDRTGDIYCVFYEKGINLLCDGGHLAFITSNKWMRAGYGEKLRQFFNAYNPKILIDLGPGVFEHATVDTNILIIQKTKNRKRLHAVTINEKKKDNIDISTLLEQNGVILQNLAGDAWFIGSDAEQRLKEKIERIGKPLKDWDVNIYYGIKTGLNEAFIIDNEKRKEILDNCKDEAERRRTEAIIKPILRGRDIKRYYYEWAGLWVIVIPAGWTNTNRGNENPEIFIEKTLPSLMEHLNIFKEKAQKRDDQGDYWWELRACAYYPEFEKEKVVYSETIKIYFDGSRNYPRFVFDENKNFLDKTIFFITGRIWLKYLLGYLNSNVSEYLMENGYCNKLGSASRGLQKNLIENIPVPEITPATDPIVQQIESLVDKILAMKKGNPQADTGDPEKEIDRMVYKLYDLTEEEIRIIEGEK